MMDDGNGRATYREVVQAIESLRADIMQRIDQLECKIDMTEERSLARFRQKVTCDKIHEGTREKLLELEDGLKNVRKREIALLTGMLIILLGELVARIT